MFSAQTQCIWSFCSILPKYCLCSTLLCLPSFEGFRDGEITLGLPTTGNKTSYLITCCLSFPIYKETAPTLYNVKDYMVLSTVPGTQQWYFLFSLSYRLLFCGPTPPNMAHLGALLYATSNPHSRSEREVKNTGKKKNLGSSTWLYYL